MRNAYILKRNQWLDPIVVPSGRFACAKIGCKVKYAESKNIA